MLGNNLHLMNWAKLLSIKINEILYVTYEKKHICFPLN